MKTGEIYAKTLPFVWAKLLLGLLTVLISIVLFAILMGIAWLSKLAVMYTIMFFLWLGATGLVNFILNHYLGYMLKAGHVAVITEAVTKGVIPDNQVAYGKQVVKERFLTSNVYFVIDKLVGGAVKQLQRGFEKVAGKLGSIVPGMDFVVKIGQMFIGIALGYIDECCLGYTFLKKEQGAFKSAADGVVIYAQNWKKLLKDAAKTTAVVVVLIVVVVLVVFLILSLVGRLFHFQSELMRQVVGTVAFFLAVFVAWAVKYAFIDSYMLVSMMVSYMQEAPNTVITFDLYTKLCGLSAKFKELFNKGQQENPTAQPAVTGTAQPALVQSAAVGGDKPVFCGNCGAKNARGKKFCGECGKPMA
jgi:hypothetical protein